MLLGDPVLGKWRNIPKRVLFPIFSLAVSCAFSRLHCKVVSTKLYLKKTQHQRPQHIYYVSPTSKVEPRFHLLQKPSPVTQPAGPLPPQIWSHVHSVATIWHPAPTQPLPSHILTVLWASWGHSHVVYLCFSSIWRSEATLNHGAFIQEQKVEPEGNQNWRGQGIVGSWIHSSLFPL